MGISVSKSVLKNRETEHNLISKSLSLSHSYDYFSNNHLSFLQFGAIMRGLAAQLYTYFCRLRSGNVQSHSNSSAFKPKVMDDLALEEDAERKIGWVLKLIFAGTATAVGYQLFPYMGDNLIQQSVSLVQVKDPLFKRMGASRIARFAIDDERRQKILEVGGAKELVNMLNTAKDDRTRKEALKALSALSASDEAATALHQLGAIPVIKAVPDPVEDQDITKYKSNLLKRFEDLRYE